MVKKLIYLYAFLLSYEYLLYFLFGSLTIFKPYRICGVALVLVWLVRFSRGKHVFRLDAVDRSLLFLFFWGLALALVWMALGNSMVADTKRIVVLASFSLAVFLVIKNSGLRQGDVRKTLLAFVWGTVSSILVALYFMGPEISGRFSALYNNKNTFGLASGLSLTIVVGHLLFDRGKSRWHSVALVAALFLLCCALLMSGSRKSIIALAASLLAFSYPAFVYQRRSLFGGLSRLLLILPLLSVSLLFSFRTALVRNPVVVDRYQSDFLAENIRYLLWKNALSAARDNYFVGLGMGQFRQYYWESAAAHNIAIDSDLALGTHSTYVDLVVNYGAVGVVTFLFMFFLLARQCFSLPRSASHPGLVSGCALPILALFAVFQSAGDVLFSPHQLLFFALLSLAKMKKTRHSHVAARRSPYGRIGHRAWLAHNRAKQAHQAPSSAKMGPAPRSLTV